MTKLEAFSGFSLKNSAYKQIEKENLTVFLFSLEIRNSFFLLKKKKLRKDRPDFFSFNCFDTV